MKLCILIQTCDSYEFLWEGLDLSWKFCWDWECANFPVYALTEEKDFLSEKIRTLKFGMQGVPPSNFSTRLLKALEELSREYDYVLYSQDDFWPMFPVRTSVLTDAAKLAEEENFSCIHVNEMSPWYNYRLRKSEYCVQGMPVFEFEVGSPFYYNHQAAIWKIEDLIRLQAPGEEPYENECRGTERAWALKTRNFFLNYEWYKPSLVNLKGALSPVAKAFVESWKWKKEWEHNMC